MQFVESSIIGLRSAVTTLTHRKTPLRFVLFPMVHVAEQQFYDDVAARARLCQLLVAEGIPSRFVPAQEWMARQQWGHLVDQIAGLRLESLGVPVRWEAEPDGRPKSRREDLISRATDIAGAATIGVARKFIDPRFLSSVEQAETYDESTENLTGSRFDRLLEYNMRTARDAELIRVLGEIHRDRPAEQVGVVFGAAHMPSAAGYLCGKLGYIAASSEWLTVVHARSLPASSIRCVADSFYVRSGTAGGGRQHTRPAPGTPALSMAGRPAHCSAGPCRNASRGKTWLSPGSPARSCARSRSARSVSRPG